MAKKRAKIEDAGLFSPTEPASQKDSKTANQESVETVKVTHYLSEEIAFRIDQAQLKLKRLTGQRGHALSKSAIVEAALKVALNELDEREEASEIATLLSKR